jgi:phosphotransferase system HPr (HPr) family protein
MTTAGPIRLTINNPSGLHARPAAMFVRSAGAFGASIRLSNTSRGTGPADAKSILAVLGLGVSRGHEIELVAEGDDADTALEALRDLIAAGIGEELGSAEDAPPEEAPPADASPAAGSGGSGGL